MALLIVPRACIIFHYLQPGSRMKNMELCGPTMAGHFKDVSSCFVQTCYINCSGYITRHEGTVLS